jgi:hypothetical protein
LREGLPTRRFPPRAGARNAGVPLHDGEVPQITGAQLNLSTPEILLYRHLFDGNSGG